MDESSDLTEDRLAKAGEMLAGKSLALEGKVRCDQWLEGCGASKDDFAFHFAYHRRLTCDQRFEILYPYPKDPFVASLSICSGRVAAVRLHDSYAYSTSLVLLSLQSRQPSRLGKTNRCYDMKPPNLTDPVPCTFLHS